MPQVELTTLTPVHVGNGNFLQKNVEFVQMNYEGVLSAGIIDDHKVLAIMGEDHIKDWVSVIENRGDLVEFIKIRKQDLSLDDISRRILVIDSDFKKFESLKEHIHNGEGRPYIPGSSLKGALRSAIFNQEIRRRGTPVPRQKLITTNWKGEIVAKANALEYELFGKDPKEDVFRFLQVGDAYFAKGDTVALDMKSLNIIRNGGEVILDGKVHQLTEMIDADIKANLSLKLTTGLLDKNNNEGYINKKFPWLTDVSELFKVINENTVQILSEEIEFWEYDESFDPVEKYLSQLREIMTVANNCTDDECIIRLGHGVGWPFINGGWVKNENILSDDIYQELVQITRWNNFRYKDYPFPKTRRVADSNTIELPGFVKLKII
jgi:CRISPR type III-A-associated RAMP protein Csm5